MNDLITTDRTSLSVPGALRPEPIIPGILERAVEIYMRAEDPMLLQAEIELLAKRNVSLPRVRALVDAYDAHLRIPLTREALDEWLMPLANAVAKKPDQDEYEGRIDAVMARDPASPPLPMACLNPQSYARAVKAFSWWPPGGKLIELLEAQALTLWTRRKALQAVHDGIVASPPRPSREAPTDEEVAAVSAKVTSLMRDLRAKPDQPLSAGADPGGVRPKSGALSPAMLAATLRLNIVGQPPDQVSGLRLRLEMLERQHPEVRE